VDVALGLFAFWPALAIGSFLNVVAARVPLRRSVVRPASACMSCGTELALRDNVPVLSWLWLRGRCRTCGVRISAVYPFVELLSHEHMHPACRNHPVHFGHVDGTADRREATLGWNIAAGNTAHPDVFDSSARLKPELLIHGQLGEEEHRRGLRGRGKQVRGVIAQGREILVLELHTER